MPFDEVFGEIEANAQPALVAIEMTIDLSENQIENLEPLTKQGEVMTLILRKNKIKELSPLLPWAKKDADGQKRTLVLDNLIHGYFILGHPERLDYDYEHIYALHSDWKTLLDRYGIDYVVENKGDPLPNVLATQPDWTLVYQDSVAVIYIRKAATP